LGAAREYCGDHLLGPADWTYQKPRELLHFLLSQQACSKEQIGLALWPDADAETLRNSFHTTLRHLRRALGRADWVVFYAGRYRLNRSLDYTSDVEQFEAGLVAARAAGDSPAAVRLLAEAVGHYRGDFLADLPGGGWINGRRADLRRHAETALLDLGGLLQARGAPGRAAEAYRRLIAMDGPLEVAHRRLMQCYADLGERGRALRQYGELVDLLAGELGVAPAPETTVLYHRLRRAGPAAA
jgi:DNA-binding SARP family transcriptional activator